MSASPALQSAALEPARHVPIEQVLEFTLERLQESLQNTLRQNEQLSFENAVLQRNIQDLRRKQEFLDSMKGAATNGSYPDHVVGGKDSEIIALDTRAQKTDELIAFFEQELKRLQEKLRLFDYKLDEQSFESGMSVLKQRKAIGEQNITRGQKKYKALLEANKGPLEAMERLKTENEGLTQVLHEINARYGGK